MKSLSIAIAALALSAANLFGQVTVDQVPDGQGGYTMVYTVCPSDGIKDFHLVLHHDRLTKAFDGHVQPIGNPTDLKGNRVGGWNAKKTRNGQELVWQSKTASTDCIVFRVAVGAGSKVRNFDDVFWVTTLTGRGLVRMTSTEVAGMGETKAAAGNPGVEVSFRSNFPHLIYTATSKAGQPNICDFHIQSLNGTIHGRGVEIPGWTMVQRGRMVSWYVQDCTLAKRSQEFKIQVPANARLSRSVWFATSAGMPVNKRPGLRPGDILELGTRTTSGAQATDVLVAYRDDGLDVTPLNFSRIGECTEIEVRAPHHAGSLYLLAAAFDIDPGIPLPGGGFFPLNYDALLEISLSTPSLFAGFQGQIPRGGTATAQIYIPPIASLAGLDFFVAGVLEDLQTVSEPAAIHVTL